MSEHTAISWADSTFNPWVGCQKVSPACDHCYAERLMDHRLHRVQWGAGQPRKRTSAANWRQPLLWEREHQAFQLAHGRRRRVFCASLSDVFDNAVQESWRLDLFWLILQTPHLDWLLLTKRIGNARGMLAATMCQLDPAGEHPAPLPNVWLGATICNQAEADRDIPKLLDTPAAVRFLSIEPMLGDIRLGSWLQRSPSAAFEAGRVTSDMPDWTRIGSIAIDWVICGGESGPHARPMHPDWVRSLRDQCATAGVPFHFKQWGEWIGADQDACPKGPPESQWQWSDGTPFRLPLVCRAGVKRAGRQLDGRTHDDFPT